MIEQKSRSSIVGGLLLVLLGALFMVYQLLPARMAWLRIDATWPLIVVGVGLFLLVLGLLVGAPDMAVPASIVGGIGLLLYWQNATGRWETWAYAWSLIPGFVGVGMILAGILGNHKLRESLEGGIWLILISLTMFAIFGSFLGGLTMFGMYWPALLIVLGVMVLVRNLLRR